MIYMLLLLRSSWKSRNELSIVLAPPLDEIMIQELITNSRKLERVAFATFTTCHVSSQSKFDQHITNLDVLPLNPSLFTHWEISMKGELLKIPGTSSRLAVLNSRWRSQPFIEGQRTFGIENILSSSHHKR